MQHQKLMLGKLENLLFTACDILRGKMDISEYEELVARVITGNVGIKQ